MRRLILALASFALLLLPASTAAQVDPALLAGLKARAVGPAAMSGRVSGLDVVESNPDVIYVGAATGGVWKSVNGGLSWAPIFDDQPVHAVGAVAVFQKNPDIVWAGTGEGNPRNSVSIGAGIYKSLDAGKTWTLMGLEKTERIHRIVLHPDDPNVAWVAALGQVWGENPDRGVFKTLDGGKTWRKVLYVDERTGAAELVADPGNPNKLFAAMWDYRRWPWFFRSGGPGSGLHVSYDAGETWKKLTEDDGLPKGDLGRMGLAISRSNPAIVYALIEADKSALVRSDDGGRTWKTVNDDPQTANRPFYYAEIRVDPAWPNRVYNIATRLSVSDDGGKTWNVPAGTRQIHGDYHAMWINPQDPEHIVVGEDGGLAISRDRGETWQFMANLPLAQYYHVAVDNELPYNIYGGLQDNGSWRGPSSIWEGGEIRNHHWARVGGGDGFDTRPDPEDSQIGYAMSQGGNLMRWNLRAGGFKGIRPPEPEPGSGREKLRFNWNAALAIDPFEPATIYYGSQYVHKSTDRGDTWTIVSPDLTTDDPDKQKQSETGGLTPDVTAAENHTTLVAIAPSPLTKGVIWTGSDDGRIHVTRDGGKTWASVEANVKGVPAATWVPHILPSRFKPGGAFAVFDNHRRADYAPYVQRTDDFGKTWTSLATKDIRGYALAVEQDPVKEDLLFLGTEFGLWVSFDGGRMWHQLKHGLPTASVMDLVIHPRDHDLVIGTHGRSLFVLDDLAPLRELTAETLEEPLHLFPSGKTWLHANKMGVGPGRSGGAGEFRGENRPYGALITYSLNQTGLPHPDKDKERERKQAERAAKKDAKPAEGEDDKDKKGKEPEVEIKVSDSAGKVIRSFKGPAKLGVNRAVWDLGRDAFKSVPTDNRGRPRDQDSGPQVPPGIYSVAVKYGKAEGKGTIRVEAEPQIKASEADWKARELYIARVGELQNAVVTAIERVDATRKDIERVTAKLDAGKKKGEEEAKDDPSKPLRQAARDLKKKLDAIEKRLWVPPSTKGIVDDQTALNVVERAGNAGQGWDAPSDTAKGALAVAERTAKEALAGFNKLYAEDVAAFRQKVIDAKIGLLGEEAPIEVK